MQRSRHVRVEVSNKESQGICAAIVRFIEYPRGGGCPRPGKEGADCEAGSEREGRQMLPSTSKIISQTTSKVWTDACKIWCSISRPKPAELHVSARREATEHDLLCQNIQHAVLHGCLEITWSCHEVARDNCEDVI